MVASSNTSIFVLMIFCSERVKQRLALAVLDFLAGTQRGVLTTQVLGELFVTLTRKLTERMTVEKAAERIHHYVLSWPVLDVTRLIVLEAARGVRLHQLSFWDVRIWATARLNQIPVIFSEDFGANRTLDGIRVVNPFTPDFHLTAWR